MEIQENATITAIREAGKKEFLQYGYEKASMRRIAKTAAVTTGAIYGYFPSKEALFDDLTGDITEELLNYYLKVHQDFERLSPEEQANQLESITDLHIPWMVNYIYEHFDVFKLLFCCSSNGAYENYISQLAEIEEASTWNFIKTMKESGHQIEEIDGSLIHILSRSFLQQMWEFVAHDVPREKALSYSLVLGKFQHAGWAKIMGL